MRVGVRAGLNLERSRGSDEEQPYLSNYRVHISFKLGEDIIGFVVWEHNSGVKRSWDGQAG